MAGPGICVLCLADIYASEVHPVFNPDAHYGYLLPNMYFHRGKSSRIFTAVCLRCDGSTACRLGRLEPYKSHHIECQHKQNKTKTNDDLKLLNYDTPTIHNFTTLRTERLPKAVVGSLHSLDTTLHSLQQNTFDH